MRGQTLRSLGRWVLILGVMGFLAFPLPAQAQTLRYTPGWFFYARDTAWFTALEKGYFRDEGLDVKLFPGSGGTDAVKSLSAGGVDIAAIDTTSYLMARSRGAPFKTVGMWHARAPFMVLTFEGSGIQQLKDLEGRTLGSPSADSVWVNLAGLAELNGFDLKRIRHIEIAAPAQNAAFMAGNFQASTAYVTQLPMLKGMADKRGKRLKTFLFANHGYDIYAQGIVVTEDFLKNRADVLRRFLRGAYKGATWAIENPDGAVKLFLKNVPSANPQTSREVWDLTIDLWLAPEANTEGLGHMTGEKWAKTRDLLAKVNKLSSVPEAQALFTNEHMPKLFPKRGPRVFPPVF